MCSADGCCCIAALLPVSAVAGVCWTAAPCHRRCPRALQCHREAERCVAACGGSKCRADQQGAWLRHMQFWASWAAGLVVHMHGTVSLQVIYACHTCCASALHCLHTDAPPSPSLTLPAAPCCCCCCCPQDLEMKLVQAKLDQALHLNTQLELKSQVGRRCSTRPELQGARQHGTAVWPACIACTLCTLVWALPACLPFPLPQLLAQAPTACLFRCRSFWPRAPRRCGRRRVPCCR